MKKIKLTELQLYVLHDSYRKLIGVLNNIKAKPLAGQAVDDMKTLEASVSYLECFLIGK